RCDVHSSADALVESVAAPVEPRRMTALLRPLAALLVLALLSGKVEAKLCGDDVGGQDVACACGDVIVSDVVLGAADPVTQERCAGDGLVVRAPQASKSLTVDLHGQTLRGLGHGAGLLLLDGGPGGASVVS